MGIKLNKGTLPKRAKVIKTGIVRNKLGCNFCVQNGKKILKNCKACGM